MPVDVLSTGRLVLHVLAQPLVARVQQGVTDKVYPRPCPAPHRVDGCLLEILVQDDDGKVEAIVEVYVQTLQAAFQICTAFFGVARPLNHKYSETRLRDRGVFRQRRTPNIVLEVPRVIPVQVVVLASSVEQVVTTRLSSRPLMGCAAAAVCREKEQALQKQRQ